MESEPFIGGLRHSPFVAELEASGGTSLRLGAGLKISYSTLEANRPSGRTVAF